MPNIVRDNGGKVMANSEDYNLSGDMIEIVDSLAVVTIVANQAAMEALDVTKVPNRVCFRVDQFALYGYTGSAWKRLSASAGNGPYAVGAGIASATIGNVSSSVFAVTFPAGRFTTPPIVTLGKAMSTNQRLVFAATNVTAAGFNMHVQDVNLNAINQSVSCFWQAVQMTPTSGAG